MFGRVKYPLMILLGSYRTRICRVSSGARGWEARRLHRERLPLSAGSQNSWTILEFLAAAVRTDRPVCVLTVEPRHSAFPTGRFWAAHIIQNLWSGCLN